MRRFTAILAGLFPVLLASAQEKGVILTNTRATDTSAIDFDRRVALVIGNAGYAQDRLKNPVNDATAIAALLRKYDFQVILDSNLDRSSILKRINAFGDSITRKKGVSLFYYSGHGVQYNAENYMLPLSTSIEKEEDIENESVKMGKVFEKMSKTQNGLNIVILDACRSNIFQEKMRLVQGLNDRAPAPNNSFVFYATGSGNVALDGTGQNSPFTESLLRNIKDSMEFLQVMKKVIKDVRISTKEAQKPAIGGSPEDDFIFIPRATARKATAFFYRPEAVSASGPFTEPDEITDWVHAPELQRKRTLFILSVGISRYKSLPALQFAAKDAMDMAKALKFQTGILYDSVADYTLVDESATRAQILQSILSINRAAKAGDMILFFFAGHNIQPEGEHNSYFVTYDAAQAEDLIVSGGGLEFERIRQFLANAPCKSILFMDGKYSMKSANTLSEIENGVAVLTSTSEGQYSLEGRQWNNGLFARALIDGLTGYADQDSSGYVSLEELNLYVRYFVRKESLNQQVPRFFLDPVLSHFKISQALPADRLKAMKELLNGGPIQSFR